MITRICKGLMVFENDPKSGIRSKILRIRSKKQKQKTKLHIKFVRSFHNIFFMNPTWFDIFFPTSKIFNFIPNPRYLD